MQVAKRLGEDRFFSGVFVFCLISDIFRSFCLVIMKYFVYLQAERVLQQSVPLLHKCE